jgi:hypothetical protein
MSGVGPTVAGSVNRARKSVPGPVPVPSWCGPGHHGHMKIRGADEVTVGGRELVVCYTDVDGRSARVFLLAVLGMLTAAPLWLLFLCLNQLRILAGVGSSSFDELQLVTDPQSPLPVVWCGVVLLPVTLMFGWPAARMAVMSRRSARGDWWLRLSSGGFAVNDRTFRPRRYEWCEIEKFVLGNGVYVCFHYSPAHRRTLANRLWHVIAGLRDSDGTKTDGCVMGYWDRPFDEAVDLMNQWLTHYKAA